MENKKLKVIKTKKLKDKLINLFAVVTKEDFEAIKSKGLQVPHKFLTIVTTTEECLEYIDMLEYEDHYEHYISWCDQRGLNPEEEYSWEAYREIVLGDDCDYAMFEIKLVWEDILAFLRMFQGCVPLGCSFDRIIETVYFSSQVKKMFKNKLNKSEDLDEDDLDSFLKGKEINPEDIVQ